MKVDFHVHTKYSPDSFTKLEVLKKVFDKKGLFPVITDHNTIKGALKFKKMFGDCIIGEEILTKEGDVIGLFLNEEIPKGLTVHETVDRIRQQGGIVYLPHPFDSVRVSRLKRLDFKPDIVEVFNSRILKQKDNKKAEEFAEKHYLLKAVGSDAHFARHIGFSYALLDDFYGKVGLLRSLRNAKLVKRTVGLPTLILTKGVNLAKKIIA